MDDSLGTFLTVLDIFIFFHFYCAHSDNFHLENSTLAPVQESGWKKPEGALGERWDNSIVERENEGGGGKEECGGNVWDHEED